MSITLNPRQSEAIAHVDGPMLVIAGAGTGKTTVLVERIARLIREGFARPGEILALTFTDNAAAEMGQRVRGLLAGTDCTGLRTLTFHAYCCDLLGRSRASFGVLTKEDLYIYLRKRIHELPLRYFVTARDPGEFLDALLEFFERCHDELVDAATFQRWVQSFPRDGSQLPRVTRSAKMPELSRAEQMARWEEIARVYCAVESMLAAENLGTFGHMISRATRILREKREALARARSDSKFLLIDEFQDVNVAQIELAELLAGPPRNIFAVGDPDQAIYRFRGATAAAFTEFLRRFRDSRTVILRDNQRSRTPILKCSFSIISHNPPVDCNTATGGGAFRREPLDSVRDARDKAARRVPPRVPVTIVAQPDDEIEAADIARAIDGLRRELPPVDAKCPHIAVLYRSHVHRNRLVKELAERNIEFAVTGINALETAEVRDLLACLRVMRRASDAESLFRVAALPLFHVDPERLRQLLSSAPRGTDFTSVLEQAPGGREVLDAVQQASQAAIDHELDAVACLFYALRKFAFDTTSPAVQAFCNFVTEWRKRPISAAGQLSGLLDYIEVLPEANGGIPVPLEAAQERRDVVRLMTAHAAKGLEFDHVFVLRVNSNSFPSNYRERLFEFPPQLRKTAMITGDDKQIHRQEERRLFYVAMTRARDSLTLSARCSGKNARPAAFARELVDDPAVSRFWRERNPDLQLDITAGAAPALSGLGQWFIMPPPKVPSATDLSATSIEIYEACPFRFKLRRDWQLPGERVAAMQFGNAMHATLRDYYQSVRAGRPKTVDQVLECFRAALAELPFDDPFQRQLYGADGERQLREFVGQSERAPRPEVLATERRFEFTLGPVRVTGRVDRIDHIGGSRVAIIDYKTGSPREKSDAERSLQLSLYALAARDLWGYIPERLVFYNLTDNSEVCTSRTAEQLAREQERVQQVANGIERECFDPKPGYQCRSCPFRRVCPFTEERVYVIQPAAEAAGVQ